MIASLHIRELGTPEALRTLLRGRLDRVGGLVSGELVVTSPLTERLLPRPDADRVAAFAFWRDEDSLDRFLAEHGLGRILDAGWQMRMQPTRLVGSWPGLESLAGSALAMDMDEPAAALTLGVLRPSQLVRFLKASARAERDALAGGAMLASTGLARPPRLVSTFSVWRDVASMRNYVTGADPDGHRRAVRSHAAQPYHRESAFVRLRPLVVSGEAPWWPALEGLRTRSRPLAASSAA